MGATVRRFLSRGPGHPRPEDEILLALVPADTFVPYETVRDWLLDAWRAEDTHWVGITATDWPWALVCAESAAVAFALRNAIQRQVLVCTSVRLDEPERPTRLAGLGRVLARRLGFAPPPAPPAVPAQSRAEREAAAVLDALGF
jgi:hypothetical protein